MLPVGSELHLDKQKWTVKGLLPGSDRGEASARFLVTNEACAEAVAKLVEKIPAAERDNS